MSRWLRQSTSQTLRIGPFLDATDGVSGETGLAGNGTEISKDGATFGTGPTLSTHDADGWYPITLTTTNTNTLGTMMVKSHSSEHIPVWHEFMVVPSFIYDPLIKGIGALQVDVAQWLGTVVPTPGTAGVPSVDVVRWNTALVATPTVAGVPEVDITHFEGATSPANVIADALLDRANAIETGLTLREAQRLIASASAGKLSGAATTTVTIRDAVADSKDRIVATVDSSGNRSAITYDVS